jgi:hypothetical protein
MPERLGKLYSYSAFESLTGIDWCPVNMNIQAPKIGALGMGPKKLKVIS